MLFRKHFRFSVVMAVHDTEAFLEQAIDSVINQSIGFTEHIQLILVDDGSTDGSNAICQRYKKRYRRNVVLIEQENAGVSAARNAGLARVKGTYVTCLDSDDYWSEDAFELADAFFTEHPDVGVLAFPTRFFGAREGDYMLNVYHDATRVVDLDAEPHIVQLASRDCFIAAELLEDVRFDESVCFSEDALFTNTVLLKHRTLGLSAQGCYWYRKREDQGSAVDVRKTAVDDYLVTPERVYLQLHALSRRRYGNVIPSVQYTTMHELRWRLMSGPADVLDEAGLQRYRELLMQLLQPLDDTVISRQRQLPLRSKMYAFALKYGISVQDVAAGIYISPTNIVRTCFATSAGSVRVSLAALSSLNTKLRIDVIERDGGVVRVQGKASALCADAPLDVRFELDDAPCPCERFAVEGSGVNTPLDGRVLPQLGCAVELPCDALPARVCVTLVVAEAELPATLVLEPQTGAMLDDDGTAHVSLDGLSACCSPDAPDTLALELADAARRS